MARKQSRSAKRRSATRPGGQAGRKATAPGPADHAAAAAVARLNAGDMQAAAGIVDQGLRQFPRHPDLLHLAGQIELSRGHQQQGRRLVEQAVMEAPDIALFHLTLGSVYVVDEDYDSALAEFRHALRLNPRLVDAHTNVGITLAKLDRPEEARAALENAVRLAPNNPQLHLNLAICDVELRRPEAVATAVARVEQLVSDPPADMLHEIGNIHRRLGQFQQARSFYRRAIDKQPDSVRVWFALGDVLSQSGEFDAALEALNEAERLGYPVGQVNLARARAVSSHGDLGASRELLALALGQVGEDAGLILRIAHEYSVIGDFAAEEDCLNRVLRIDPDSSAAFAGLVFAPGRRLDDADVVRLRVIAADRNVDTDTRGRVLFALGNHYRHHKRVDESFECYRLGNRLKGFHFDANRYAHWIGETEKVFDRTFFADRREWGRSTGMPLLIVGMPRSGTTLTEQILSAHPLVYGAGEYGGVASLAHVDDQVEPDFRAAPDLARTLSAEMTGRYADAYLARMQALAEHGESVVTNKLPHNFEQLGLFGLLFPSAPVVHVRRDPRDNLLSLYFHDFEAMHEYAYDMKTLGRYYRLYERLMRHWLSVIPNPVYELRYEDLVADLPGKSRELAAFAGIPWDEAMLRFHENERLVQTASKWQVRQQLYTSSVGRWRPYEKHLRPMFDALGPVN